MIIYEIHEDDSDEDDSDEDDSDDDDRHSSPVCDNIDKS